MAPTFFPFLNFLAQIDGETHDVAVLPLRALMSSRRPRAGATGFHSRAH